MIFDPAFIQRLYLASKRTLVPGSTSNVLLPSNLTVPSTFRLPNQFSLLVKIPPVTACIRNEIMLGDSNVKRSYGNFECSID